MELRKQENMTDVLLTYDDVLCVPGKSLDSRKSANIKLAVHGMNVEHPIIPANMDTISGESMCEAVLNTGGIAIIHRFMDMNERHKIWTNLKQNPRLFISIGVSPEEVNNTKVLHVYGVRRFCIDIAHGHSDKVAEIIKVIRLLDKKGEPSIIIAGNVATVEGFKFLADAGADIIKVGIGPGSHCTTRIITGCGVPQFSAIQQIVSERNYRIGNNKPYIHIIADGGIKYPGDITKAIGAGADFVMTGSLFAGCDETPGDIIAWKDGTRWKIYRGMASKDAQVGWRNSDPTKIVAEGESSLVPAQGSFKDKLHQVLGGLQSGMSYIGASTIEELQSMTKFVRVSPNTVIENSPHGKKF